jgi:hypothetical protein
MHNEAITTYLVISSNPTEETVETNTWDEAVLVAAYFEDCDEDDIVISHWYTVEHPTKQDQYTEATSVYSSETEKEEDLDGAYAARIIRL